MNGLAAIMATDQRGKVPPGPGVATAGASKSQGSLSSGSLDTDAPKPSGGIYNRIAESIAQSDLVSGGNT